MAAAQATQNLNAVLQVFAIAPVDEHIIRQALSISWEDFEDAVQMAAAARVEADDLVTRNPGDFKAEPVTVLLPEQVVALLKVA